MYELYLEDREPWDVPKTAQWPQATVAAFAACSFARYLLDRWEEFQAAEKDIHGYILRKPVEASERAEEAGSESE